MCASPGQTQHGKSEEGSQEGMSHAARAQTAGVGGAARELRASWGPVCSGLCLGLQFLFR